MRTGMKFLITRRTCALFMHMFRSEGLKPSSRWQKNGEVSGRMLVYIYFLVLLVVSIPSKFIFYFAAPLGVLALIFCARRSHAVISLKVAIFAVLLAIIGATSLLLEGRIALLPAILWPFTYGAFLLVFLLSLLPLRVLIGFRSAHAAVQLATYWLFFQGLVGVFQFLISKNADAVAGTVGLLDFMGNITINQVYFGFAVLSLLPAVALYPNKLKMRVPAVLFGLIAVGLSQSGHATLAFLLASIIIFGITSFSLAWVFRSTIIMLFLAAVVGIFYPSTVSVAMSWADRLISPDSPKVLMVRHISKEFASDVKFFLLGAGPGQYISKASLTGSGILTRVKLPYQELPQRLSAVLWIFDIYEQNGEGSAVAKPYNSLISIFSEWGLILASSILILLLLLIAKNATGSFKKTLPRRVGQEISYLKEYLAFYWLFLVLVSLVELYFEMPAAIIPGGWLTVIFASRIAFLSSSLQVSSTVTDG